MSAVQKKYFAGILAAALALAGCSTTSTGATDAKGINAVATTTQICDYLTQIANHGMKLVKTDSAGHETTSGDGDVTLNLTCLLAPNASAHEHEMTPQQMKALAQADLLFVNGVDHLARPLFVVGDGGGQGLCQVVIDNLDFFAFQFAQIHFQVTSSTISVR